MQLSQSYILASAESITAAVTYPIARYYVGDASAEVAFYIDIQSVQGGTDVGATLTVSAVSGVIPHTTGSQYMTERVFALDAVQRVNLTAEGEDWPSPLCTGASSFPLTYQRTYIGFGKDLRLTLTPALSGAVTGFTATVVMHVKG